MLLLIVNLFACGDKSTDTGTETTDTSTTDTADTTETDPCAPLEGLDGIGMTGEIIFADGTEAQGNVRVQMCNADTCYVAKWGDSGFCFPEGTLPSDMPYAFDIVPTIDADKYANPLTILTPTESFALTSPLVLPEFTHTGSTDTDFDAGNGLVVSNLDGTTETIMSTSIDLESGGLPLEHVAPEKVLAGWYFGPFDTHLETGATLMWSNENIVSGTTYQIHNGDYENQSWQITESTASSDGVLEVPMGLTILSSLLITE